VAAATIAETLAAAVRGEPAVTARPSDDGGVEYVVAGRPFAVLEAGGLAVSFRLSTPVAAAAVKTPDVVPSGRGAGWVTIRPSRLDAQAIDRVNAWFDSARRLADGT
jgi:hypothetical protein